MIKALVITTLIIVTSLYSICIAAGVTERKLYGYEKADRGEND